MEKYVIGLDYGTDSARAVLVNAQDGKVIAESVSNYSRWAQGKYCDNSAQMFRQHPLDYYESLKAVLHGVLDERPDIAAKVCGIGIDCTGATPCLVLLMTLPATWQLKKALPVDVPLWVASPAGLAPLWQAASWVSWGTA